MSNDLIKCSSFDMKAHPTAKTNAWKPATKAGRRTEVIASSGEGR